MTRQTIQKIAFQAAAAKAAAAGDAEAYAAARRLLDANANGMTFSLRPREIRL